MIHLLDSHVLVWMMLAPEKLGKKTRALLESSRSQLATSSVSLWEIEYKRQQARLILPEDWADTLPQHGIEILSVSGKTALLAAQLPIHGDPFDRIIMAQAPYSSPLMRKSSMRGPNVLMHINDIYS